MKGRIASLLGATAVAVAACGGSSGVDVEDSFQVDSVPVDTSQVDSVPVDTSRVDDAAPSETEPPPTDTTAEDDTAGGTDGPVGTEPDAADVGAPGVGDSLYPDLGNGGYDVVHYDLELDVEVDANDVDAIATLEAVATQPLGRFNLDLQGLEVASVRVDDDPATVERTGHELVITPAVPIDSGATFTVVVDYSGSPEPIADPAVPFDTVGWQQREGTVYVASEPSGAMSWFPSNNHPTDKATFEISVTTDAELTVVSNGVLVGVEATEPDRATTTWRMADPMTTYLAAVYIGEFELRESVTDDGLRIRNYFPPAFADELTDDFELTVDVLDFYEDLFGADYPFDEYGSIVVPFSLGFALENQTISIHGLDATDPYTIAHEILHQWSGNSVTVADWQDIWMLEGFATYLAYMYFEDRGLSSDIEPRGMYAALRGDTTGPAEVPIEELFGLSVYFRGGMTLHALRVEVGDETFREILATYYERFAGGDVSTAEFRDLVGELAGADAVAVLDDWLYGEALPPFPE